MPELPEVETIARGLNRKLRGRKITGLWTDWPKYFKRPSGEAAFRRHITAKKITGVSRRAKNIFIHLSDPLRPRSEASDHLLLVHQKMTGHLMVGKWKPFKEQKVGEVWAGQKWIPDPARGPLMDPMNRFIRLIFFLDNKEMLALSDLRRFAKVLCGPEEEILDSADIKKLGPEPLDEKFGYPKFRELFKNKKGRIKQVLMDQNFISGIGNIYADEILWLSKIHPQKSVEDLKEKDLRIIFKNTRFILKKALRLRGTSIDDYRDAEGRRGGYDKVRYVYQREDEPCPRCGTEIKRLKIGGRSAHFCPKCQKV
ncbi:MAG: Formamidopyrimidine-DNA glycosylase [Candidatus Jorgensenbacteria bacterium GW2011_GWA1_48_13]|uniref:Formamidopyrimidine-DNA glycosylase n=2 Tax=Candidatus Joergenseniibacteriota TaxID=1752739 RepID=A0A0G1W9Q1_9BACT|nr:MAG: Formamidopyrimidine-DNA glycosylase [Candidatus Jorgensenbacteria bacterium GW2011_GWA1_48_13]KKU98944.1 MAG: Formamidopyrimidine-DNA glycosylase [Candidatus Jorgensenbacteria bacterium GW2011_GWC1_48_8]KKW15310.1 MAG: Formamidopyrimidine-DNA glycosylase [Candidatus Jorgensenbacteria bacterium GW2011_GWB1_50_10]